MVIRKHFAGFHHLLDTVCFEMESGYGHSQIRKASGHKSMCEKLARQIAGIEELDTELFESLGRSDELTDTLNDLEDLVTGYPTPVKEVKMGWGTVLVVL